MKQWILCYCFHLGLTIVLGGFLLIVTLLTSILFGLIPVFGTYLVLFAQIMAFLPFARWFARTIAPSTQGIPPKGVAYVSSLIVVHFWSFVALIQLIRAYFLLQSSGVQALLVEQIETGASNLSLDTFGIFEPIMNIFLEILVKIPSSLVESLDNMVLKIIGFFFLVIGLFFYEEYKRNQEIQEI